MRPFGALCLLIVGRAGVVVRPRYGGRAPAQGRSHDRAGTANKGKAGILKNALSRAWDNKEDGAWVRANNHNAWILVSSAAGPVHLLSAKLRCPAMSRNTYYGAFRGSRGGWLCGKGKTIPATLCFGVAGISCPVRPCQSHEGLPEAFPVRGDGGFCFSPARPVFGRAAAGRGSVPRYFFLKFSMPFFRKSTYLSTFSS